MCSHQATGGELHSRIAQSSACLTGQTSGLPIANQLLLLNILMLTDEEKAEMRASDARAQEILERTEALTAEDFMRLHGTIREFQWLRGGEERVPRWEELERPVPQSVVVRGTAITKGSKVRLCPRPGGDIFDLALAGKVAVVE